MWQALKQLQRRRVADLWMVGTDGAHPALGGGLLTARVPSPGEGADAQVDFLIEGRFHLLGAERAQSARLNADVAAGGL